MSRRHIAFIILVNTLVSLVIALGVNWAIEQRRPDPEELAARSTPLPQAILAPTRALESAGALPAPTQVEQTPTVIAPAPASGDGDIYVVQNGDILSTIAAKFNTTVEAIMQTNGLENPDFVFVGQRLRMPSGVQVAETDNQGEVIPTATPAPVEGIVIASVTGVGDLAAENVLIVNEGTAPVNLQGWTLARADGPTYRFGDVPLFAGSSVRLHTRAGDDSSIDLYWTQESPAWQSASTIRLMDAQGTVIVSYTVP